LPRLWSKRVSQNKCVAQKPQGTISGVTQKKGGERKILFHLGRREGKDKI